MEDRNYGNRNSDSPIRDFYRRVDEGDPKAGGFSILFSMLFFFFLTLVLPALLGGH